MKSRAASLLAFGRWKCCSTSGELNGTFPISESQAYDYLCELRILKAAPLKSRKFFESVGFAKGLLGADVDSVLSSVRVRGVAFGTEVVPAKRKDPLTCEQLIALERLAFHGDGPESIFSGYICFLVHCRLRWSDGQYCIVEPSVDITEGRGFVEAALYHHKTAKKRRTHVLRLLPVAGVIPGLSGLNWATEWLDKKEVTSWTSSIDEQAHNAGPNSWRWLDEVALDSIGGECLA